MNQTPYSAPQNKFDSFVMRLPLLWLSLAFLSGILAASRISLPSRAWLLIACLCSLFAITVLGVFFRLKTQVLGVHPATWFIIALSTITFNLGALSYQQAQPKIDAFQVAWYNDRKYDLLVTGTIASPPDVRDTYTNLRLEASKIDTGDGDMPVNGLVLARVENGTTWQYGDVVRLRGQLVTPPENEEFSYRDYLARQGIHAYMASAKVTRLPFPRDGKILLRWIYDLKAKALEKIYIIFQDPEASLMAGILLGVDTRLSADLQQAFRDTGTAHIVAISGFNVAIIAGFIMILFGRLFGPRRGPWLAIVVITIYTILVGAEASVVRAAIMGGLGLLARQVGRRQTAITTLVFTGAIMSVINPFLPWDIGFQLSFLTTLGLILYGEAFHQWTLRLVGRLAMPEVAARIAKPITEYLLLTLAAQITSLPIIAWHFGRISLVSLVANPFILPVQPLVMILGGLALLVSFIYIPLGTLIAWAAWPFAAYTIHLVEFFSRLPHGVLILGDFSFLFVLVFYTILLLWTFSKGFLRTALRSAFAPTVVLVALATVTFLAWNTAFTRPDGQLHITFLSVGSSDAVLVQTPAGRHILINGGERASTLSDGLGRRLSPFKRSLDWVVVASPEENQVSALPGMLDRFPTDSILWAGNADASYSSLRLVEWAKTRQVPITYAEDGYLLDLGNGALLETLDVTPRGAVILITWGDFRALLPLGLNFDSLVELDYGERIGAVDVLLIADSGYEPLNRGDWFNNLKPQVFILDVAADDRTGLPDEKVVRLTDERTLLRTDLNGWIEITTDGANFRVETEK